MFVAPQQQHHPPAPPPSHDPTVVQEKKEYLIIETAFLKEIRRITAEQDTLEAEEMKLLQEQATLNNRIKQVKDIRQQNKKSISYSCDRMIELNNLIDDGESSSSANKQQLPTKGEDIEETIVNSHSSKRRFLISE